MQLHMKLNNTIFYKDEIFKWKIQKSEIEQKRNIVEASNEEIMDIKL
jgi:hypothetical protein